MSIRKVQLLGGGFLRVGVIYVVCSLLRRHSLSFDVLSPWAALCSLPFMQCCWTFQCVEARSRAPTATSDHQAFPTSTPLTLSANGLCLPQPQGASSSSTSHSSSWQTATPCSFLSRWAWTPAECWGHSGAPHLCRISCMPVTWRMSWPSPLSWWMLTLPIKWHKALTWSTGCWVSRIVVVMVILVKTGICHGRIDWFLIVNIQSTLTVHYCWLLFAVKPLSSNSGRTVIFVNVFTVCQCRFIFHFSSATCCGWG